MEATRSRFRPRVDPQSPAFEPKVRVVKGPEAEAVADTPKLTGDSEWDDVELEETSREPLSEEFLRTFLS